MIQIKLTNSEGFRNHWVAAKDRFEALTNFYTKWAEDANLSKY